MKPPAPGPVSGDSATQDISTHATAASTALPPSRRTSAPARAVTGWPAATTPLMRGPYLARNELRDVDVVELTRGAPLAGGAPHPRLGVGGDARLAPLAPRRGPMLWAVAVAGGHDGDPHLVVDLLVDHGTEDDVGVRVGGLRH